MSRFIIGFIIGGLIAYATISKVVATEFNLGDKSFKLTTELMCDRLSDKKMLRCYLSKEKCFQVTRNYSVSGCVNFYPKGRENENGE